MFRVAVTLAPFRSLELDPFKHQRQLRGVDLNMHRLAGWLTHQAKCPGLETFVTHIEMQAMRLQPRILCV